ncbi:polyamine aminopropyltransferase [Zhaonella formicivorans]|uniref:polyamine aminopropyltransferase n=1 Tax=Zhaonella formicivorans TaxID=2528593 RepID=UPI0010D2447F|nr:polyamine aminopropyltransferase [Zhaonella formicivorans]
MEGVWFQELQTKNLSIGCSVKEVLLKQQTDFQKLQVLDTDIWGRMLVLDGAIQTTIEDEFVYHEMITHVALNTHPNPKRTLIIGGGDGGAIREMIKHDTVEKATLVEIDKAVIEAAKKYLPEISVAIAGNNPRVEVLVEDGIKHIKEKENYYDIVIVDSTDPVGPAVGLFAKDFYAAIHRALKDDGIFVAQTESPFYNKDLIRRVFKDISSLFPITKLFTANVPTYPGGLWSFTMGSKVYDPEKLDMSKLRKLDTKYYTPEVHKASFVLPKFVGDLLK